MQEAKILGKGQLVIPVSIRKKLGLKPGDSVKVFDYDGAIHVIPSSRSPVEAATGILPPRPSLSKKLLRDRARE
ncbi:MAG: AbrB/MazE/SpoVT family DNA-binding domain-containing protein [Deltaproteobacteria bacterium]|nr:AbrB/MazE/SpoVT family DNA-binding domain-containing protein [Deltaproteobacteria bacterium]